MSLTDEQIKSAWDASYPALPRFHSFARAIESAATAPLLERIAMLEREIEALRKDAGRWAMLREESKRVDPVCALLWKKNSDRSSNRWVNVVDYDKQVDAAKERP